MSASFDILFHWALSSRRVDIARDGLKVYSEPVQSGGVNPTNGNEIAGWPYLCFSPRPSRAWSLSGDMHGDDGELDWDLWEVKIPPEAHVRLRDQWGPEIVEVRVYTSIPPEYMWLVGQRIYPSAIERPPKRRRAAAKPRPNK